LSFNNFNFLEKKNRFCYNIFIRICFIFTVLAVLSLSLIANGKILRPVLSSSSSADTTPVVIIDAGHGGFDGGAVANDGTSEKNINLSIAKSVKAFLSFKGVKVLMTRDSDTALNDSEDKIKTKKKSDMQNRLKLMTDNPDALFVSIHLNKFTTSNASGAQIFYSGNLSRSEKLGENIRTSIVSLLQKENKRTLKLAGKNIFLLKNATVPAVIVECGFLSNQSDLALLKTYEYQSKLAFCISDGIINYLKCGELNGY